MDAKRKTAYRKILYHFLIQIKNPTALSDASAAPVGRYASLAAYALHNFALASANDFVGFDEAQFWATLDGWNGRYPNRGFHSFRRLFEQALAD